MDKPIFLVGFMGSGKTTWGKKIAASLALPFIDLDQEIVNHIGMSITAYFNLHGEEKFRRLERDFLIKQIHRKAIVSTGGGTPCYYDNMDWIMNNGVAIYLYHTPKSLWSRLSQSDINKRPVLKGLSPEDLMFFIEHKLQERSPYYEQAHLKVDQMHTPLEDVLESIKAY